MAQLTRHYLESRGFYEHNSRKTGYRTQFTATTEDNSFYLSLLSTASLLNDLREEITHESFEVIISGYELDGYRWVEISTQLIISTVEEFEILLKMLKIKLKMRES